MASSVQEKLQSALEERLDRGTLTLPVLPNVAQEVIQMTSDDQRGSREVARLIEKDPVLCAHVLRAANSPLYGAKRPITSLRQSVNLMGMQTLAQIAITVAMESALMTGDRFREALERSWSYALASAYFAREIARKRRARVESSFLTALLQRIGEPAAFFALSNILDEEKEALEAGETGIEEAAERVVDALQERLGLLLVEEWTLPPIVQATLQAQNGEPPEAIANEVHTARLARAFAVQLLSDQDDEALREHPSISELNLYPDAVEELLVFGETIKQELDAA